MPRYLALATAIVLACILAIVSFKAGTRETPPEPYGQTVAHSQSPGAPLAPRLTAAPLWGDAPWALSALPDCFRQTREVRGSPAYVRDNSRDLARPAWRRVRHVRLVTADCRVDIADRSALVVRGDTRLQVPSDARFYVSGHDVIVDRFARGSEDLRVYVLRDGKAPVFAAR